MTVLYCLFLIGIGMVIFGDGATPAQQLTDENIKLLAKVFPEISKNDVNKSFALSPFSVMTPLAQLALASEGKSHKELLNAIGMPDDQSIESVFAYADTRFRSLKGLTYANKVYVDKHYTINQEFSKLSKKVFHSDVQNIDFSKSEQSTEEINAWVTEETNDNVEDIVSANTLSENSKLLLVSVDYFKGMWKNSFHPGHTINLNFRVSSEKNNSVPYMYRKSDYNYKHNMDLKAKILEIPYEDEKTSFFLILPDEVYGITDVVEKVKDKDVLQKALNNLELTLTKVYIPKFKLESTINLKEFLPSIGVEKVFVAEDAKLNKLVKESNDFTLSDAVQKVFIEISEEGVEQTLFEFEPPYYPGFVPNFNIFFADHPFMFLVRTGQDILLAGVYYS